MSGNPNAIEGNTMPSNTRTFQVKGIDGKLSRLTAPQSFWNKPVTRGHVYGALTGVALLATGGLTYQDVKGAEQERRDEEKPSVAFEEAIRFLSADNEPLADQLIFPQYPYPSPKAVATQFMAVIGTYVLNPGLPREGIFYSQEIDSRFFSRRLLRTLGRERKPFENGGVIFKSNGIAKETDLYLPPDFPRQFLLTRAIFVYRMGLFISQKPYDLDKDLDTARQWARIGSYLLQRRNAGKYLADQPYDDLYRAYYTAIRENNPSLWTAAYKKYAMPVQIPSK